MRPAIGSVCRAVIALAPALLDPEHPDSPHSDRRCDHPVTLLDELVDAMGNAMHRAGVVRGAAYEHLRLAMTAPMKVCRCNGHGCETYAGRGTVPAEPPDSVTWAPTGLVERFLSGD